MIDKFVSFKANKKKKKQFFFKFEISTATTINIYK